MTVDIQPKKDYDPVEAREEMKQEFHKQTEELSEIFQSSLTEMLFEVARNAVHPLVERVCLILDLIGYAPPEKMEKPPQEELDEILKHSVGVVAEKASRSAKRSVDTCGDVSINSYHSSRSSLSGWMNRS